MLADEIVQRRESGHVVANPRVLAAAADAELRAAIKAVEESPRSPDWPYEEPEGLAAIKAARPTPPQRAALTLDDDALLDRLHGAWLGRCAGCALGKPVENWPRAELRRYLERFDAYPLRDYIPADGPASPTFPPLNVSWPVSVRGAIRRDATGRRHRLHDPGPARARDLWGALPRRRCGSRVATAAPVHGRLYRRARRLPQPRTGTCAASERDPHQPLPRVDRRADPCRRIRLCCRRRPGEGLRARVRGRIGVTHGERRLRRDVGGRVDCRELRRADDGRRAGLGSRRDTAALASGGGASRRDRASRSRVALGAGPRRPRATTRRAQPGPHDQQRRCRRRGTALGRRRLHDHDRARRAGRLGHRLQRRDRRVGIRRDARRRRAAGALDRAARGPDRKRAVRLRRSAHLRARDADPVGRQCEPP